MTVLALAATAAYLSWVLRSAGEDPPTFVGTVRQWLQVRLPRWTKWMECIFCTVPYAAVPVATYAAAVDLIQWRETPLILGLTLVIGLLVDALFEMANFLGDVTAEIEGVEETPVTGLGMSWYEDEW